MDVTFRPATKEDIPDLARLHLFGRHGIFDALYHDCIAGLPANEIYERVLVDTGSVWAYENASVAVHDGRVIGEVHAFAFGDAANDPPSPMVPKDRLVLLEPFDRVAPQAVGTYHINILSVYPEFRGKGIGTMLMNLARSHADGRGFSKLSLFVFEDTRAVNLYERLGFVVCGRSPIVKHELLHVSGDLLVMTRPV